MYTVEKKMRRADGSVEWKPLSPSGKDAKPYEWATYQEAWNAAQQHCWDGYKMPLSEKGLRIVKDGMYVFTKEPK